MRLPVYHVMFAPPERVVRCHKESISGVEAVIPATLIGVLEKKLARTLVK